MPLSIGHPSGVTVQQAGYQFSAGSTGVKRGRLLIRQQRVKKDGEIIGDSEASNETYSSEYLLTVPSTTTARIERHASEPSPSTGLASLPNISNQNLLTVVSPHSPYLVKQHSHPLLPSQMTSSSYQLTRQLSYPNQMVAQQQSTSTSMFSSHTSLEATASGQLLQHHHHKPPVRSQTMPHYVSDTEVIERNQLGEGSTTVVLIPESDQESTISISMHQSSTMPQQPIHQKQVQLPLIRVKSEELQRSISSPLVG